MKGIVLTGVGFAVGVFEALIYYNIGQSQGADFKFRVPPRREFVKTAGIVLLTSLVTTALFKGIEMMMEPGENREIASSTKK